MLKPVTQDKHLPKMYRLTIKNDSERPYVSGKILSSPVHFCILVMNIQLSDSYFINLAYLRIFW